MIARISQPKSPLGALLFTLLALAWCGYVAFPSGNPAACTTSGCALFRDVRILGVSMWWVGGTYFFVLALVCLRGFYSLAWWLARTALLADTFLLLIMLFSAPCLDCLVVALFFPLIYLCLRPLRPGNMREEAASKRLLVLSLWVGLFVSNAAVATNEMTPLWAIGNPQNNSVRVFFSPSCPYCRDALVYFGPSVALHPVVEREGDMQAIIRLEYLLAQGTPMEEALRQSRDQNAPVPALSLLPYAVRYVQTMRNKAAVFRQGHTSLPLININGMPKAWLERVHPAPQGKETTEPAAAPLTPAAEQELWGNDLGQCNSNAEVPCP